MAIVAVLSFVKIDAGEMQLSTRMKVTNFDYGATVLESDIPGPGGHLYDLIWDITKETSTTYSYTLGQYRAWEVWDVKLYYKINTDSTYTYAPEPPAGQPTIWNDFPWRFIQSNGAYYSSNNYVIPNDVPLQWVQNYFDLLDSTFYCEWQKPDGTYEDRANTGDWYNTCDGMGATMWANTSFELVVVNWDDRNLILGNNVKITYLGDEGDLVWNEFDCVDATYSHTEIVDSIPVIEGDGTYPLDSYLSYQSMNCGLGGIPEDRIETALQRDHLLQAANPIQTNQSN